MWKHEKTFAAYILHIMLAFLDLFESWKVRYVSDMTDKAMTTPLQNFDVTFDLVSSIWRENVRESLALGKAFCGTVVDPKNLHNFSHFAFSRTSSTKRFSLGIEAMTVSFQVLQNVWMFSTLEKAWLIDISDQEGINSRAAVWTLVT